MCFLNCTLHSVILGAELDLSCGGSGFAAVSPAPLTALPCLHQPWPSPAQLSLALLSPEQLCPSAQSVPASPKAKSHRNTNKMGWLPSMVGQRGAKAVLELGEYTESAVGERKC